MAMVIQCDRCKSVTKNKDEYQYIRIGDQWGTMEDRYEGVIHLCPECLNKTFGFLKERREENNEKKNDL